METSVRMKTGFEKFRKYYRSIEPIIEKPKNRAYTAIVFSFLAISLFAWYAIRPTIQTILYLQREIVDKTALNKKMEDKIANLIEAQASYEAARDMIPLLADAIPDSPEGLDAITQLKNLVSTTEATLSSVRVSNIALGTQEAPAKSGGQKTEFPIYMTVEGAYPEIETFLTSIQTMRRVIVVDQITFTPNKDVKPTDPKTGNNLKLTVQLKAYYQ